MVSSTDFLQCIIDAELRHLGHQHFIHLSQHLLLYKHQLWDRRLALARLQLRTQSPSRWLHYPVLPAPVNRSPRILTWTRPFPFRLTTQRGPCLEGKRWRPQVRRHRPLATRTPLGSVPTEVSLNRTFRRITTSRPTFALQQPHFLVATTLPHLAVPAKAS